MAEVTPKNGYLGKLSFDWALLIVVSVGYIAAYTVTNGFVLPLQKILLPDVPVIFSLLFLPHGVRVMAIWLLGWRGAVYLLPSGYLMWALSVYGKDIVLDVSQPIVSIICVYAAVALTVYLLKRAKASTDLMSWKGCVLAGAIASIFNGIALSYLASDEFSLYLMLGYAFGDITGQIVLMVILILIMRVGRGLQNLND